MRNWRAVILGACLCVSAGGAAAQELQGHALYMAIATIAAGRDIKPDGPEVKQVIEYVHFIAKRYSITELDVAQTTSSAFNIMRPRIPQSSLFELLDAAQRIAPSEKGHDRAALVHALTRYVGSRTDGKDVSHEQAIARVIAMNEGRAQVTGGLPEPVPPRVAPAPAGR
ncbi:MAG TPA: hypothetical protein VGN52_21330 [Burkholderiales bacterium]|jgi:hypothetical protein